MPVAASLASTPTFLSVAVCAAVARLFMLRRTHRDSCAGTGVGSCQPREVGQRASCRSQLRGVPSMRRCIQSEAVITFVAHEKRSMALSRVTDVPHIACTRGAGLSAACPSTKCLFKVHDSVGHGTVHYLFHALVACYAFVRRTRCIARSMVDCRLAGGCRVRGAMPDEGAKPSSTIYHSLRVTQRPGADHTKQASVDIYSV